MVESNRQPPAGRASIREEGGAVVGVDVEVPLANGYWYAYALLVPRVGRLVIAELRFFPADGERPSNWLHAVVQGAPEIGSWSGSIARLGELPIEGVTTRLIRETTIDRLIELAEIEIQETVEATPATRAWLGGRELEEATRQRPGRRGRPISYYLQWAMRYVELVDRGSTRVNRDLAERFDLPVATVTQIISTARNRHRLLTKTKQGQPGGRLTAKAERLVERLDEEMRATQHDLEQNWKD